MITGAIGNRSLPLGPLLFLRKLLAAPFPERDGRTPGGRTGAVSALIAILLILWNCAMDLQSRWRGTSHMVAERLLEEREDVELLKHMRPGGGNLASFACRFGSPLERLGCEHARRFDLHGGHHLQVRQTGSENSLRERCIKARIGKDLCRPSVCWGCDLQHPSRISAESQLRSARLAARHRRMLASITSMPRTARPLPPRERGEETNDERHLRNCDMNMQQTGARQQVENYSSERDTVELPSCREPASSRTAHVTSHDRPNGSLFFGSSRAGGLRSAATA